VAGSTAIRHAATDPHGRRSEAAFEDTQAMLAQPAGGRDAAHGAGAGDDAPGGRRGRRHGDGHRDGRGPVGPGGRGPGGPGGSGPGGPGGPEGPDEDGPEAGTKRRRTGWKRFVPSWKIVMAGITVFAAGVFGMIAVAYAYTPTPTVAQEGVDDQGSVIYYDDGKTVLARLGIQRVPVTIDKIPEHVQDAVIAIENRTFWEDSGIDFRGMVRSVWSTATGQQVQGASTITQQMARNYYEGLSQERSFKRKIKEIFVAVKLDKEKEKSWILQEYLNTIYFGRGAYGIQAASKAFFNKSVGQLTPPQAAYLAARIQNPSAFDEAEKAGNMAPSEGRYRDVLNAMALTRPDKYRDLPTKYAKAPKRIAHKQQNAYKGLNGYMIEEVLRELQERGISEEDVKKGGYKIYSTFNKKLMIAARDAVVNNTAGLPKDIHTGLAAVDPTNGRVRAFFGGTNYLKDAWNEPFQSQKQAASAFKPYVLAAWLDSQYSLNSYLPGRGSVKLPGTTAITNDHNTRPAIDVITATAQSVNTAYAKMGEKVGLDKVIDVAAGAGLNRDRLKDAESRHHYLITIGSSQVTAVEQAAGYSIFANAGKHYDAHVVIKVVDRDKMTVFQENKKFTQVISPEAAADATVALQEVTRSGTARGLSLPGGHPVAGKTGTNNENKEAWFVGFTSQLSTAVGMYREQDGKEVSLGNIQGATYPTRVWRAFMAAAMEGQEVVPFPPRANVGDPENIVPKPEPTPTVDPEPRFPTDDDFPVNNDNGFPDNRENQVCQPWDGSCDDGSSEETPFLQQEENPFNGGTAPSSAAVLDSPAARRDSADG
jgi:membrane peptidoglycan carboxypeptidase